MVDFVESIGRKLERNDNSSQGFDPQLKKRGPLRWPGPFSLLRAPQIAGALGFVGRLRLLWAPQIAEGASD